MRLDKRCRRRSSSFCCSDLNSSSFACCAALNSSSFTPKPWSIHFGATHLTRPKVTRARGVPTVTTFRSQSKKVIEVYSRQQDQNGTFTMLPYSPFQPVFNNDH